MLYFTGCWQRYLSELIPYLLEVSDRYTLIHALLKFWNFCRVLILLTIVELNLSIFPETTSPRLVRSMDSYTDGSTITCITSGDIDSSASNPVYSVQVDDVTTDTMAVQIYYGETMDNEMCNQLEKVLFTYFPNEGSCDYYKQCVSVWECHPSRICEFQCNCPGNENESCELNILRRSSEDVEWSICDIRV